jgi:hypothetical protein
VRLELDENLGSTCIKGFRDAATTSPPSPRKGRGGAFDADVLAALAGVNRALVTLDLYFSNPFRFLSEVTAGIGVLRVSDRPGSTVDLSTADA